MRIIFMGTPEAAVPPLERLINDGHEIAAVWTQPDRPSGRGNKLSAPPVKVYAESKGLSVHQPSKIRTPETVESFREIGADLAVVVAYGRILPAPFLEAPRQGCVNVHFSLLPAYRGAAPVNWAIIRGESETGVTTMLMDEGLDTGPVLLRQSTQIGDKETAPNLMKRLSNMGADLLSETIKEFETIVPEKQDSSKATFAPILTREDGLIDWNLSAAVIERMIRGLQPWPNAFTFLDGKRMVITNSDPTDNPSEDELPGTVLYAHGDSIIIACGDGSSLRVNEIQPEGKRRMSTREFLNGLHVRSGMRFG